MNTPLTRVRRGFAILGVVVVISVIGYRSLGYPWLEAIWMVVITIASVGFGERSQQPASVQLLTIAVVIFGLTAAAYTFGALLQLLLAGELEQLLGRTLMTREIKSLHKHTIVVGFGRIGRILAAELHRQGEAFVIVEINAEGCREAHNRGYLHINGDATEDDVLVSAGLSKARCLVSALPNDANNVFITLTARNLNSSLEIIARAEHGTSERKLIQAGANRIVMPSAIGAQQIGRMITRPHTADLLELFAEQGNLDLEIDEIHLPTEHALVGKSIEEIAAQRTFSLLILAVRQPAGEMIVGVGADYRLSAKDVLIVLAKPENLERFRKHHGLGSRADVEHRL
jgi:voltage-gated potassium channel